MDFAQIGRMLQALSGFSAVLIASLAFALAMATCICAYVGVRAALDARQDRNKQHVLRDRWLAEQDRIHRESVEL